MPTTLKTRRIDSAKTIVKPVNKSANTSPKNIVYKVLGSPLFWILAVIALIDICVDELKPLRYVSTPGVIFKDRDPVKAKIEAIDSWIPQNGSQKVFLMGTSLSDSACANGDAKALKLNLDQYKRNRYNWAKYFDNLANSKIGLNIASLNLGFGGSMVSGQELILNNTLENDDRTKRPNLVFLMVAPRAFIDNTRKESLYPITSYFNNRHKASTNQSTWQEVFENKLAQVWSFYRQRSDYSTVLTKSASWIFNRPENAYTADKFKRTPVTISFKSKPYSPDISNKTEWVEMVQNYYSSAYGEKINRQKYRQQLASFSNSLTLLKTNGITTIVVSMPLSKLNRAQIPAGFEQEYKENLKSVCNEYDARLIYLLDDSRFELEDYRDSVHLNGDGAIKFWQILTDILKHEHLSI